MFSILIDPTKKADQGTKPLAPRRFDTLHGVTIGLVGNSKVNADEMLFAIGELLQQRYRIKGIVHDKKPSFSVPAPDEVVDKIAREADVVIAGVGD